MPIQQKLTPPVVLFPLLHLISLPIILEMLAALLGVSSPVNFLMMSSYVTAAKELNPDEAVLVGVKQNVLSMPIQRPVHLVFKLPRIFVHNSFL